MSTRTPGQRRRTFLFLGEGVVLDYINTEPFGGEPVETIRVDDRRYGLYLRLSSPSGRACCSPSGKARDPERRSGTGNCC